MRGRERGFGKLEGRELLKNTDHGITVLGSNELQPYANGHRHRETFGRESFRVQACVVELDRPIRGMSSWSCFDIWLLLLREWAPLSW